MEKRFGTVWQAEGAFRTTTFVHQKPNLRLMASARGRRSARYVAHTAPEIVKNVKSSKQILLKMLPWRLNACRKYSLF